MKRIFGIFGVMLISMALMSGYLFAHDDCGGCDHEKKEMHRQRHIRDEQGPVQFKLLERLDLSEVQKESIQEMKETVRKTAKILREERMKLSGELREELTKDFVDQARVDELKEQINELHSKMLDQRINTANFVREILTSDQFQRLEEMRERIHDRQERAKDRHRLQRHKKDCDH